MTQSDPEPSTPWPSQESQYSALSTQDFQKALLDAQLETVKASLQAPGDEEILLRKAAFDANLANLQKFSDSYASIVTSSVDRASAAAELVQKASAGVAALYTGALAVAFSVTDNPLPLRGALTPLFLGLAVVLSTAYTSFLTWGIPLVGPEPAASGEATVFSRLRALGALSSSIVRRRSYALRASVVSLGVGLLFLAAPFITAPSSSSSGDSAQRVVPSTPDWPTLTGETNDELGRILYSAKVDEVQQIRALESSSPSPDATSDFWIFIVLTVLGILAVLLVPLVGKGTSD